MTMRERLAAVMKTRRHPLRARAALLVLLCLGACVRELEVEKPVDLGATRETRATDRHERRGLESMSRGSLYAGMPVATTAASRFEVLANEGYTVGYSEDRRNPLWAAYELFRVDNPTRYATPHRFAPDPRTQARVDETCFAGSAYARGRQAPSYAIGTRYGGSAQAATLLMSNVSPRMPKLERQTWRALERLEADEYAQRFGRIWVVTGPIFDETASVLPCDIMVPNAFYRIIIAEPDGTPIVLPIIMTQEDEGRERLRNFTTTVDQIEELTGLDFFPDLPVEMETTLESSPVLDDRWDVDRMLDPP